jgi:Tfp pilus assembly major pilin PilA
MMLHVKCKPSQVSCRHVSSEIFNIQIVKHNDVAEEIASIAVAAHGLGDKRLNWLVLCATSLLTSIEPLASRAMRETFSQCTTLCFV